MFITNSAGLGIMMVGIAAVLIVLGFIVWIFQQRQRIDNIRTTNSNSDTENRSNFPFGFVMVFLGAIILITGLGIGLKP